MEHKVKSTFQTIAMPPSCTRRIADALEARQAEEKGLHMRKISQTHNNKRLWLPVGAALCLLPAVLLLLPREAPAELAPATSQPAETLDFAALEEKKRERQDALREKIAVEDAVLLRSAMEEFETKMSYTEGNIHYMFINGGQTVFVDYDTELHTPFTEYEEGKVWFIANGERRDITEDFSEEEPFTYIYTDRKFMEHYIAIGGTAENPGWLEMVHTAWGERPQSFVTGEGHNTWNNAADARYGWETRAKEIFAEYDVHWPS